MTQRKPARGYTALLLAGRRGPDDPLAAAANAPHRALLDINGVPMLERVLRVLVSTPCIGDIVISIDEPALLDEFPGIVALRKREAGHIVVVESGSSPSRSVLAVLAEGPPEQPMLVTTADHALLTVEMTEHFLAEAESRGGDVAVALVAASILQARFPEAIRTYLPFAGERYSGANLFALLTPRARRAVEFWTRAESFRKRPWRLVAAFGPRALLLFLLRRLDVHAAFERVSLTIGARVAAVEMPQAEAAVDVDKLADLELVRSILADEQKAEEQRARTQAAADTSSPQEAPNASDQSERSPSSAKPPLAAS